MNILGYAASSSRHSINKQIVEYAGKLLEGGLVSGVSVELIDINDYEMPLFSVDRQEELGIPQQAQDFFAKIGRADGLLLSFAEHNGHYTAAYKNLFDWTSRIETRIYQGKPTVMFATSPGARGGRSVLDAAVNSAPFLGNELRASLAIPKFYESFDQQKGVISDEDLDEQFRTALRSFSDG